MKACPARDRMNATNARAASGLCVLASADQFDRIKQLTRNPEFICFNCGRVAKSPEHLCNPMPNE